MDKEELKENIDKTTPEGEELDALETEDGNADKESKDKNLKSEKENKENEKLTPEEELETLELIYPDVKPYMAEKGIKGVEAQGKWVVGEDGGKETPLVFGKECVYVFFDQNNIAKCAIEAAYRQGKIKYKKPISCELYPVRISSYPE